LTFLFLIVVVALAGAGFALVKARRAAIRLERLSESYWELRYEYGQLASRVTRLETLDIGPGAAARPEPAEPAPRQGMTFVPLSSLKR
jgi:hypothetical protein